MINEYNEIWKFVINVIKTYNDQYEILLSEMFNDDFNAVEVITDKKLPDIFIKYFKRVLMKYHNHIIINIESIEGYDSEKTILIIYFKNKLEIRKNKIKHIKSIFSI